jgi:hypothetical protein
MSFSEIFSIGQNITLYINLSHLINARQARSLPRAVAAIQSSISRAVALTSCHCVSVLGVSLVSLVTLLSSVSPTDRRRWCVSLPALCHTTTTRGNQTTQPASRELQITRQLGCLGSTVPMSFSHISFHLHSPLWVKFWTFKSETIIVIK